MSQKPGFPAGKKRLITGLLPNRSVACGVAGDAQVGRMFRQLAESLGPRNIRVDAVSASPVRTLAARGKTAGVAPASADEQPFLAWKQASAILKWCFHAIESGVSDAGIAPRLAGGPDRPRVCAAGAPCRRHHRAAPDAGTQLA